MMKLKKWLNKSITMEKKLKQLEELKEKEYSLATGCTSRINGNGKIQTNIQNTSEDNFVLYSEYSKRADELIIKLLKFRVKLLKAIDQVQNKTYKMLLIERYINCETWEHTAETIGHKDVRNVYRLHKKALESLKISLNDNFE